MTTGANIWRFLDCIMLFIDFEQKLLRKQLLHFFYSILSLICAQMTERAVMISRVTPSRSGMCGVLAFVLFFH